MNTYYEIIGIIEGESEVIFGSFDQSDCRYELESEREQWEGEGYKDLMIISRETTEEASGEIYETVTSQEVFQRHAPNFNFDLNEEQLVEEGLKRGFLSKAGDNKYIINKDY